MLFKKQDYHIESIDKLKEIRPIAKYSGVSKEYLITPKAAKDILNKLLS